MFVTIDFRIVFLMAPGVYYFVYE